MTILFCFYREKQKTEEKDRKVLDILRLKDEKITELQRVMEEQGQELEFNKHKYEVCSLACRFVFTIIDFISRQFSCFRV